MPMKILIMGPRFVKNRPDLACGTTVLFEDLLKQLDDMEVEHIIIDTNKSNYINYIFSYPSILIQMITKQRNCTHISLHSSNDYMIFGIFIILLGKVLKKKLVLENLVVKRRILLQMRVS